MNFLSRITWFSIFAAASTSLANSGHLEIESDRQAKDMLLQVEALRHKGDYDEAIKLAEEVRSLTANQNNPEVEVEAIYQLAVLYYRRQDYARARAEMEVGLARSRVHGMEGLEADFLAAEGVLEWKQGNLHLALPKLQEAMAIRESKGDSISMASISNNIGIIYYTLKNYEDAEFYYRKGLEMLAQENNQRLRSSLYSNLAEILIPMNRLDEAEDYLHKALEIEEQTREPHNLAYTYYNLGELQSQRGNSQAAIDYYARALQLQKQIKDSWGMALTRLKTSQEYLATGLVDLSLQEANTGYELVQDLNALSLLRDYCAHFIEIYRQLGELGRVQYFTDQHDWLVDRIKLEESGPELDEPVPVLPIAESREDSISPVQTAIILILAALIIVLILENARLRNRMTRL